MTGTKGSCSNCKNAPARKAGLCPRCYFRLHCRKPSACPGCERTMPIVARGLCGRCYYSAKRVLGAKKYARRQGDDGLAARAHERAFTDFVVPAVRRCVGRMFRYLDYNDRQEVIAESVAYAWLLFSRLAADGHDPAARCATVAEFAVKKVRRWRRITGNVSTVDVLSPRFRWAEDAPDRVGIAMVDATSCSTVMSVKHLDVEHEEWLASLHPDERRVVEHLLDGYTWADVRADFGMKRKQVNELVERLWRSWCAFTR